MRDRIIISQFRTARLEVLEAQVAETELGLAAARAERREAAEVIAGCHLAADVYALLSWK